MASTRTALFSRNQPGGVFTIADLVAHPGSIFFVHSGTGTDGAGYGDNPDSPLASVDYAIGLCTASKGDVIYVMPGHAESFSAADGFDVDKIGIRIIGLGQGALRPTFTFADTDATVAIGAASVHLENMRFVAGLSAVVVGIDIEAAATDCTIKDCEFYWGGTTTWDFVRTVIVRAAAHRATFENCRFLNEPAVAGNSSSIEIVGATHNCRVIGCEFMGDSSLACISQITPACEGLMVINCLVHNTDAGEPYLEVTTGTTGVYANCRGQAGGATVAANAVADSMSSCNNFVTNTKGTIAINYGAAGVPALDAD